MLAVVGRGVDSWDEGRGGGGPVFLPIEVQVEKNPKKWIRLTAPCLMPPVYYKIKLPENSKRPIARNRNAQHFATMSRIVAERVMHNAPIVPECN